MKVLNCKVPRAQLSRWVDWLAPDRQPFYLTAKQLKAWKLQQDDTELGRQLRDTYLAYYVDNRLRTVWLDEETFLSLPQATRAALVRGQRDHQRSAVPSVRRWRAVLGPEVEAQADGHRFVWWKSLLQGHEAEVLPHIISKRLQPSRHREVGSWPTTLLPRARELAGTWSVSGVANCFGTVMAAAGVEDAAETWMQRDPFEVWLADNTTRGGRNDVPGTVFVWRDTTDHLVQHAAVTLGGGYMFHKPSQRWVSPRKVLTVAEVRRSARTTGWRLEKHTMLG